MSFLWLLDWSGVHYEVVVEMIRCCHLGLCGELKLLLESHKMVALCILLEQSLSLLLKLVVELLSAVDALWQSHVIGHLGAR